MGIYQIANCSIVFKCLFCNLKEKKNQIFKGIHSTTYLCCTYTLGSRYQSRLYSFNHDLRPSFKLCFCILYCRIYNNTAIGVGADLAQVNLIVNCWPNQAKMSVIVVFQLQFTCSIHDLGPNVCLTPARVV